MIDLSNAQMAMNWMRKIGSSFACRASADQFTVVIPTKNSAGYIDIILDFYRSLGVAPVIFVDDASMDGTYDICRALACRTELVSNPLGRVEGIVAEISKLCDTDWILRFDDDELPSIGMLRRARELCAGSPVHQHAFRLRHCLLNDEDGLSALYAHEDPPHDQWRLYNRRHVSFIDGIHTPGIAVQDGKVSPPDHYFVHLQWIVRSFAEREAKIEHYDRHMPNAGSSWRKYYLIEEDPPALASSYPIDSPEFVPLAQRLASRFPLALRVPTYAARSAASR